MIKPASRRARALRIRVMKALLLGLLLMGFLQAPAGAQAGATAVLGQYSPGCVTLPVTPHGYDWSWGTEQQDQASFRMYQTLTALATPRPAATAPASSSAVAAAPAGTPGGKVCVQLLPQGKEASPASVSVRVAPTGVAMVTMRLEVGSSFWIRHPVDVSLTGGAEAGKEGASVPLLTRRIVLSSRVFCVAITLAVVGGFYGLLARWVHGFYGHQRSSSGKHHGLRVLDPIVVSAGEYGGASLSNLQILWFTLIVAGLLVYAWLVTGSMLSPSVDVLWLLGIASGTKVVAASIGSLRQRLSLDNWNWLVANKLLRPEREIDPVDTAQWRDLVLDNGTLEPSRYQLVAFGFLIGISLLFGNIDVIQSFQVPEFFRTLQGLSSGFYLFGKFVSPDTVEEFNKHVSSLRTSAPPLPISDDEDAYLRRTIASLYGQGAVA